MPPRKKIKPETFDGYLADVVESKRAKRGLTVEELAERSGISYQTLRRRLGGAPFTVNELGRVSAVLAVQPADLVQEAVDDYGGIEKLLREYAVSEAEPTVEDNVTYIGRLQPEQQAADVNPRKE